MLPIQVIQKIQQQYNWEGNIQIKVLKSGLINHTWKVITNNGNYILQAINTHVFSQPEKIDHNLRLLSNYFSQQNQNYLFVGPMSNLSGKTMIQIADTYYRVFPFIEGTHTKTYLTNPDEAFEAAYQFGKFTALLVDFNQQELANTIPFFHHLAFRYWQFQNAWQNADGQVKIKAEPFAYNIHTHLQILEKYNFFIHKNTCLIRTMHHDTKISNVLFNEQDKGVAVIDLDTIMPGYFFSDLGDMMRTYISSVSEEEKDLSSIAIRKEFLEAVMDGYLTHMDPILTSFEKENLLFSGQIITFMQALRFLTDFLQNNQYYNCTYPDQNLYRTANQLHLLKLMQELKAPEQKWYFTK
ncbi:MAG: aminoglycoside phosphotransferase family protein [Bacteroidota bacterium]|nr:aminoglycoside phosphotransferase family protein [Bacteroidota bacterium]